MENGTEENVLKIVASQSLAKQSPIKKGEKKCPHCPKKLSSDFFSHIINNHFKKKNIKCGIKNCESKFTAKGSYVTHINKVHGSLQKNQFDDLMKNASKLKPNHQKLMFT